MSRIISTALTLLALTTSVRPDTCAARANRALDVAKTLQDKYFTPKLCQPGAGGSTHCSGGNWDGLEAWQNGPMLEALINVDEIGGFDDFEDVYFTSNAVGADFQDQTDDAGWGVLMMTRIVDHYGDSLSDKDSYVQQSLDWYNFMSKHADDDCQGGLWWDGKHGYKNTISNVLYLLHASAALYYRHGDQDFMDAATSTWNWMKSFPGLRNDDGLWVDGVHWDDGKCTVQTDTWTYTQGVMASALGIMHVITGEQEYLDEAENTVQAVVDHMTENGILKENHPNCDDVNADNTCTTDQQMFKGNFMTHMMYFLDQVTDDVRAKYAQFVFTQSSGVEVYATGGDGQPSNVWYAGSAGHDYIVSAQTVSAGVAAHIAAAKYSGTFCK